MSALTEQEINQFFKGLTDENFFQRLTALDPENVDLVKTCESAQEALRSSAEPASTKVLVGASHGVFFWKFNGGMSGHCPSFRIGAGGFTGDDLPPGTGPGTFEMDLTFTTCELRLNDARENPTWKGTGFQGGLNGSWKGSYA